MYTCKYDLNCKVHVVKPGTLGIGEVENLLFNYLLTYCRSSLKYLGAS